MLEPSIRLDSLNQLSQPNFQAQCLSLFPVQIWEQPMQPSLDLQDTFKSIESDRLLIETDSPFLAPVPMRGNKNEPSFIKYTLQKLSEIKGLEFSDMQNITSNNFTRLFFNYES